VAKKLYRNTHIYSISYVKQALVSPSLEELIYFAAKDPGGREGGGEVFR